jgi:hypothetical protein
MKQTMHDPKFEKTVQRKMEELEFVPSETVWENIEMAVTPRQRRRAVAMYWWLLVPTLFLAGAGGVLFNRSLTPAVAVNKRAGVSGKHPVGESGKQPAGAGTMAYPGSAGSTVTAGSVVAGNRSIEPPLAGARNSDGRDGSAGQHLSGAQRTSIPETNPDDAGESMAEQVETAKKIARQPYTYRPGLISSIVSSLGIRGPRLATEVRSTAVAGIPTPKRPWMAGFTGGGGLSSFNESLTSRMAVVSSSFGAMNVSRNTGYSVGNSSYSGAKTYTSAIEPDFSFFAGIFAQKPLSSRWSVSIGLNVHYYSSRLHIGQEVNYYVPSASSLIAAPAAFAAIQPYPSYSTGDQQVFTNRYYYLEMPVAMEWQINRSRILPLFLRGGAVLSRLMGSNALYYNDQSGVYLKDNGVINHTQLSFSSALTVGLPFRNVRVQAGPEFQYGVTNLFNATAANGHLFFGGVRVAVMR